MIRTATPADRQAIAAVAVAAGMFTPDETGFIDETLGADSAVGSSGDHCWLVDEDGDGAVTAAAYFAPEPFADRLWNLYFIAVHPDRHGRGLGRALIDQVDHELRRQGPDVARVLLVETSSTDQYGAARALYTRLGFVEEARIRQFYGPSDDKVVFWKQLRP